MTRDTLGCYPTDSTRTLNRREAAETCSLINRSPRTGSEGTTIALRVTSWSSHAYSVVDINVLAAIREPDPVHGTTLPAAGLGTARGRWRIAYRTRQCSPYDASVGEIGEKYRAWAQVEAQGVSDLYFDWATGVAADEDVVKLVEELPSLKRQPNLIFASARMAGVPLVPYQEARSEFVARWDAIRGIALTHATQTNEVRRCAVLLPELAKIPGPIALLEVGASAGLCLYPDKYAYRFITDSGVEELAPAEGSSVVVETELRGRAAPTRLPEVVWRAGIDLNPLDVAAPAALHWLETLVWPEHDERRRNLHAAASVVTAERPLLVAGDLNEAFAEVVGQVPADATLVVFHSAVLVYLSPSARESFVCKVRGSGAVWISNEGKAVLPEVAAQLPAAVENGTVLAVDGTPIAIVGPHGQFFHALAYS